MDFSNFTFRQIEADTEIKSFDCGDAYAAAVPFYEKCGFMFLSEKDKNSKTRAMYFDLINFVN